MGKRNKSRKITTITPSSDEEHPSPCKSNRSTSQSEDSSNEEGPYDETTTQPSEFNENGEATSTTQILTHPQTPPTESNNESVPIDVLYSQFRQLKKMIRNNCPLNQIQDPKKKISRFLQNITIFMKKSATHQTMEALTPFIHTLQQLLNPPIENSITLELLYKMNAERIGQLLQILHYFECHKHNK